MRQPKRIWWARPRKLCAMERPGGGGQSHRPDRREEEIEWLKSTGVNTVISTMRTRHNLAAYEQAGMRWLHVPADDDPEQALEQLLPLLRRELRKGGAVAVHGNRYTDFVAAACAACVNDVWGVPVGEALARAAEAGLTVTEECAALVGAAGAV